jgi:N utilization substance protein B
MGIRRSSRELALKFLYQSEFNEGHSEELLSQFIDQVASKDGVGDYMRKLVVAIFSHRDEIDSAIQKYSEHWALDRMTLIDRNILRMGVCELVYLDSVPPKVAINEAVEIAKKFGNDDSPDFINGVLDHIFRDRGISPAITPP